MDHAFTDVSQMLSPIPRLSALQIINSKWISLLWFKNFENYAVFKLIYHFNEFFEGSYYFSVCVYLSSGFCNFPHIALIHSLLYLYITISIFGVLMFMAKCF